MADTNSNAGYNTGEHSPTSLPMNMMAQLYEVPESGVKADVLKQHSRKAAAAKAPRGHRCIFEMARSVDGSAPLCWVVAAGAELTQLPKFR